MDTSSSVNTLVFKRTNYNSLQELSEEITKQLQFLLRQGYLTVVYRSLLDENLYVIEYSSVDAKLVHTPMFPIWLTTEEVGAVEEFRSSGISIKNSDSEA